MRAKKFLAMAIALGLAVGATVMPTLAADKNKEDSWNCTGCLYDNGINYSARNDGR